jgi:hypothetical protein
MAEETPDGTFYVAPFAVDGELLGVGRWDVASLSPRWLIVCERMIRAHGGSFRASFGQALSHIEVKLTAASGVGLGTFYAHGRVVVSTAYLRGGDADAEGEVVQMLINSLRKVSVTRQVTASDRAFEAMATIAERPLHLVVAWADENVSKQDQDVVTELATHFAAAYLCCSED